ncbi:hypothetical protein [Modestobacter altitudinis]|uniref:hypothetical protein n=1 Tax=Modestobacter altitudinis TaxID=2213158 RepID=UPI00110C9C00|nr:hypothetical protein [Modestobacter altitudinis]
MSDDDAVRDAGSRVGSADRRGAGTAPGRTLPRDHLRRIAVLLETAAVLDGRASRTGNAVFAEVLRERATRRRETAAQLRAGLWGPDRRAAG